MINRGKNAADIGTDHARLPVYLIKNQICKHVTASDLNDGPLEFAEKNIRISGLGNITLLKSDGFSEYSKELLEMTDEYIIAGIGGELIVKILDSAPEIKNIKNHFVLQPMTKIELLREYLKENGYRIEVEEQVKDKKHVYTVMSVYII